MPERGIGRSLLAFTVRRNKMGLDCYFREEKPVKFKTTGLCGGIMSGDGSDGSFRGKVYAEIVDAVTEGRISLYTEDMPSCDITAIAEGFMQYESIDDIDFDNDWQLNNDDFLKIKALFLEADDMIKEGRDIRLIGWW